VYVQRLPDQPPAILLVHGFASSVASSWVRFGWIEALTAAGFTVIASDLPGHGSAVKSEDPGDYASIEEDVRVLVLGREPLPAVGFSMGGRILLRIESEHPGTFERIVVGGLGANVLAQRRAGALADAIESGNASDADGNPVADTLLRAVSRRERDRRALVAVLRRPGRRHFTRQDLTRIRCPVLVVVGELDSGAHPPSELLDALPRASLRVIPDVDHVGTVKSPEFLWSALPFLSRP
jgi:pimeloyl-ACP methyl ester carboxylesterase